MKTIPKTMTPLLAALAAALALGACSRHDERTGGRAVDDAVARLEPKTEAANNEGDGSAADTKAPARSDADARVAAADGADKVATAVNDATITTTINAEFAKDGTLSGAAVDVDTSHGHVALRGAAPSAEAKLRATQIAMSIKGVTSVDNLLTVQGKS